jgi:hypothetical protein
MGGLVLKSSLSRMLSNRGLNGDGYHLLLHSNCGASCLTTLTRMAPGLKTFMTYLTCSNSLAFPLPLLVEQKYSVKTHV